MRPLVSPRESDAFGLAMKPSKPLRRYALKPPNDDAPDGHYKPGILNEGFAALFGRNISIWVHVEDLMIGVLQDLLGGGKRAPARQIFHSIVSNQARKSLLLTCLQRSKINAKKTDIYETIIQQFSNLNAKRNTFLHGLWYTHESGRVFLSESAVDDFHYFNSREVKIEELEEMDKAMGLLSSTIMMRRSPSLAKLIALPQKPQQTSVRRNKKEYRQSTPTKRSTPPQSSEE
jgi:hypothetical protein